MSSTRILSSPPPPHPAAGRPHVLPDQDDQAGRQARLLCRSQGGDVQVGTSLCTHLKRRDFML